MIKYTEFQTQFVFDNSCHLDQQDHATFRPRISSMANGKIDECSFKFKSHLSLMIPNFISAMDNIELEGSPTSTPA